MKGQIQLRNKEHFHDYNYKDNENGDGIGIAFQLGNPDELGIAGGDLGIGGLPDAVGFKFDTFFNKDGNTYPQTNPKALTDDKCIGHKYGDVLVPSISGPYGSYPDDTTPDPQDPNKYYFDTHINTTSTMDKGFVYTSDIKDPDKVYGDTYVDKDGNLHGQIRILDKNDPNWYKGYTRYFAHPITSESAN